MYTNAIHKDGMSGLSKAKANMHKPAVSQFFQYMHIVVSANSKSELTEPLIQAKLAAAGGVRSKKICDSIYSRYCT